MGTTFQFDIEDLEKAFRPVGERLGEVIGKQLVSFRQQFEAKLDAITDSGTIDPQGVRMSCVELVINHLNIASTKDAVSDADALAQYVLTGKKPGAEG